GPWIDVGVRLSLWCNIESAVGVNLRLWLLWLTLLCLLRESVLILRLSLWLRLCLLWLALLRERILVVLRCLLLWLNLLLNLWLWGSLCWRLVLLWLRLCLLCWSLCRRTVANTRGRKTLIIGISRCRLIGLLSFSLWSHVVAWGDWVGVEHDTQCSELVTIYTVIGVVAWFFVDNYRG